MFNQASSVSDKALVHTEQNPFESFSIVLFVVHSTTDTPVYAIPFEQLGNSAIQVSSGIVCPSVQISHF